jgi:hypothetical protein
MQVVHDVDSGNPYPTPTSKTAASQPSVYAPHPDAAFFYNQAEPVHQLDPLSPMPSHMLLLWQVYVECVDPLIKILHTPTTEKLIRGLRGSLSSCGCEMEALLFAVALAAVASVDEDHVLLLLNRPKAELQQRFLLGTEQALARARFLTTRSIVVLQALVLYLSLLPHFGANGKACSDVVERETRRRVWWQLCFLDSATRRHDTPGVCITASSFTTALPTNMSDFDLAVASDIRSLGPGNGFVSEATFCLVRCELWQLTQALQNSSESASRLPMIKSAHSRVWGSLLRMLNPQEPWHMFLKTTTTLFFAKVEMLLSGRYAGAADQDLHLHVLKLAVEVIMAVQALKTEPSWACWRWQFRGHVPWHALAVYFDHEARGARIPESGQAWTASSVLMDMAPETTRAGAGWPVLMDKFRRAQAGRDLVASGELKGLVLSQQDVWPGHEGPSGFPGGLDEGSAMYIDPVSFDSLIEWDACLEQDAIFGIL